MASETVIVAKCLPCDSTYISRASFAPSHCPFCRTRLEPATLPQVTKETPRESFFYRVFRRMGLVR